MWPFKQESNQISPRIKHLKGRPEVNNWVVSEFIVKKIIPLVGVHPYPLSELQLLVDAVIWVNPKQIFEWGTHIGAAARIFSETLTYFNLSGTVYSIDLPDNISHEEHPHDNRGMLVRNKSNVKLIQGDGINSSKKILKKSSGDGVLFFLDGDHSYQSVSRELREIGNLYPRASIIGHDTLYQDKSSNYNIGPHQAFKEFIKKYPKRYMAYESNLGLPGMTLLIPKE